MNLEPYHRNLQAVLGSINVTPISSRENNVAGALASFV